MKSKSIGIVGSGFVGKAVFKGFSLYCETKIIALELLYHDR